MTRTTATSSATLSSTLAAYYGILPALASTMCCWGPPLLSVMGAAAGASTANAASSTTTSKLWLQRVTRYRPWLLGLSASMIGYSFVKVYYTIPTQQQQQQHACCRHANDDAQNLKFQRAVVWASLAVALAGASYGRVSIPKGVATAWSSWRRNATAPVATRKGPLVSKPSSTITSKMIQLDVDGMACAGCANKVRQALQSVDGVVGTVTVDHVTGKTVIPTEALSAAQQNPLLLKTAIQKAGFAVREEEYKNH